MEFKNRARPLVVNYLQKSTGRTGSVFLDMTDVFGGVEGDVYTDYCHLTPMGNKKLAEKIGEQILPLMAAKPATNA